MVIQPAISTDSHPLRVALVAGTLGKGGAEKQLVLMVKALKKAQVDVRVYCATSGEFYESHLRRIGCDPIWFGQRGNPLSRTARLTTLLRKFRPDVVQSAHFYTNLYVALASKTMSTLALGSLRNDAIHEVEANGRWGPWLIRMPPTIVANSAVAKQNAQQYGVAADRIHVLSNVIDLEDFDARLTKDRERSERAGGLHVISVCRLVKAKRVDRLLEALRRVNDRTNVTAKIVGDGPERENLERHAKELGLTPSLVEFTGWRDDVPGLLHESDVLVISSDHEGFPNVLLEAMAAQIPAVSTPAGDAGEIVQDSRTGFVVPFGDIDAMAARLEQLACEPETRQRMGRAARARVEETYSEGTLAQRLLQIYRDAGALKDDSAMQPLMSVL